MRLRPSTYHYKVLLKSMKLKNLPEIRHPEADAAQAMVRQQMNGFGLQTITKILQPGAAKYPLRKVCFRRSFVKMIFKFLFEGNIGSFAKSCPESRKSRSFARLGPYKSTGWNLFKFGKYASTKSE